jgi:hypothetical protein
MKDAEQGSHASARRWMLRLGITLAVMAILVLRKSDTFTNPQLWAEDGGLFLAESDRYGAAVLFKPYQGYQHFLPRVIAAAGRPLALQNIPVFYASVALAVTGLTAWAIQSPRVRLPGAWAAALALATIPHNGEVHLTICNLQWITAVPLFALAFTDDATTHVQRIGDLLLLIFAGLSGPFVVLALPLLAWRAWRRPSGWSRVVLAVAAVCVLIHAPSLFARSTSANAPDWAPLQYLAVVGRRLWAAVYFGETAIPRLVCVTLALALPLAIGWAVWRRRVVMPGAGLLVVAALLVLAATAIKARPDTWGLDELALGDRYFYVPKVLFTWLIAALASTSSPLIRVLLCAVLILPLVVNARRFLYPPFPPQNWSSYATEIERGRSTLVSILPRGFQFFHPGRRPPPDRRSP